MQSHSACYAVVCYCRQVVSQTEVYCLFSSSLSVYCAVFGEQSWAVKTEVLYFSWLFLSVFRLHLHCMTAV